MKSNNINGKIHISEYTFNDEEMVFSWDYAIQWEERISFTQIFSGDLNGDKTVTFPDNTEISIVFWNSVTKQARKFEITQEELYSQKIIIKEWKNKLEILRQKNKREEVYIFLHGREIKGECEEWNYVFGGDNTTKADISTPESGDYLESGDLHTLVFKKYTTDNEKWLFQMLGIERLLDELATTGKVVTSTMNLNEIKWNGDSFRIYTGSPDESVTVYDEAFSLLYDDESKLPYRHELKSGPGYMEFGPDYVQHITELYIQKGHKFRTRVYIFLKTDGIWKIFLFVRKDKIKKDTKYNKSEHYDIGNIYTFERYEWDSEKIKSIILPYYTAGGHLRLISMDKKDLFSECGITAKVTRFKIKNNKIQLVYVVPKTLFEYKETIISLRNSIEDRSYVFSDKIKENADKYVVKCSLLVSQIEWAQFYWDVHASVVLDGEVYTMKLKNFSRLSKLKYLVYNYRYNLPDDKYIIFPYMTRSRDFAITYRLKSPQDRRSFVAKEYLALFISFLFKKHFHKKNIWLIYEKYSITAQDNSLYFFEYCMKELPEEERRHIYYVIDKSAKDYLRVKEYSDKVIQFLSLKHLIYLKTARLLISSDTRAHSYAWHSPNSLYRYLVSRKRHVFLQHGVIYYKKCHRGLKKNSVNGTSLFIVSSGVERSIIRKYFGYKKSEIAVTGLARWDVLRSTTEKNDRIILVMPTWRTWLEEVTEEEFKQSDYYKNYMDMLNNEKLHDILRKYDTKMIFYIHPKFREYISAFATDCEQIEMVEFGNKPLNELLMKCNMMVTDYSSACWDVYYQGKPVVFFLFDLPLYDRMQGSYIDMWTQSFGDTAGSMDELMGYMEYYINNGFVEKPQFADMRDELLPMRDHNNCARTYYAIMKKFYKRAFKMKEWDKSILYGYQIITEEPENDDKMEDSVKDTDIVYIDEEGEPVYIDEEKETSELYEE